MWMTKIKKILGNIRTMNFYGEIDFVSWQFFSTFFLTLYDIQIECPWNLTNIESD